MRPDEDTLGAGIKWELDFGLLVAVTEVGFKKVNHINKF